MPKHETTVEGFFRIVSAELDAAQLAWPAHADILRGHTKVGLVNDIDITLQGLSMVSAAELVRLEVAPSDDRLNTNVGVLRKNYDRLQMLSSSAQCECRAGLVALRSMLVVPTKPSVEANNRRPLYTPPSRARARGRTVGSQLIVF